MTQMICLILAIYRRVQRRYHDEESHKKIGPCKQKHSDRLVSDYEVEKAMNDTGNPPHTAEWREVMDKSLEQIKKDMLEMQTKLQLQNLEYTK